MAGREYKTSLHYDDQLKNFEIISKSRKALASASLFLALVACVHETARDTPRASAEITFPHPSEAPYCMYPKDDYYNKLERTRAMTDDPVKIDTIDRLLQIPVAQWLNGDTEDTERQITEVLRQCGDDGTIPLFVVYNIPNRDRGGEAGGGMPSPNEYREWTSDVSDMIGDASAVTILEPDALPDIPNLSSEWEKTERILMLNDALATFQRNNPNMAVYLDAGNSKWRSAKEVAELIGRIDPKNELVGGIALNVANRRSERETKNYAEQIEQHLGRSLRVMIDNSRNGAPNTDDLRGWCNVPGTHVGVSDPIYSPTKEFEISFIKTPGESDGRCGDSDKPSGEFDPDLLLDQVS